MRREESRAIKQGAMLRVSAQSSDLQGQFQSRCGAFLLHHAPVLCVVNLKTYKIVKRWTLKKRNPIYIFSQAVSFSGSVRIWSGFCCKWAKCFENCIAGRSAHIPRLESSLVRCVRFHFPRLDLHYLLLTVVRYSPSLGFEAEGRFSCYFTSKICLIDRICRDFVTWCQRTGWCRVRVNLEGSFSWRAELTLLVDFVRSSLIWFTEIESGSHFLPHISGVWTRKVYFWFHEANQWEPRSRWRTVVSCFHPKLEKNRDSIVVNQTVFYCRSFASH